MNKITTQLLSGMFLILLNQNIVLSNSIIVDSYNNETCETEEHSGNYNHKNSAETLIIHEILFKIDGEGYEFIELYNTSNSSINVSGWYFSDGVSYTFPSGTVINGKSYYTITGNLNQFQTKFGIAANGAFSGSLSNGGEKLVLRNSAGGQIDVVDYLSNPNWPVFSCVEKSLQLYDTNLNNAWAISWLKGLATPNTSNAPDLTVIFSLKRGWYEGTQTVSLTCSNPNAAIYFTNDSIYPSNVYTNPITINDNGDLQVIRAFAYINGIQSQIFNHTYVFRQDMGIPVISIWPNNFPTVNEDNAPTGTFEFLPPPSVPLPSAVANADYESSERGEHEKVFFRCAYGNSKLTADLFSDNYYGRKPITKHKRLAMRTYHQDHSLLRNAIGFDSHLEAGGDGLHGRYVNYYINGEDEDVRFMMERYNEGYSEEYNEVNDDLWNPTGGSNTNTFYPELRGYLDDVKAVMQNNYNEFKRLVNVKSYINFIVSHWFAAGNVSMGDKISTPANANDADGDQYAAHWTVWDFDELRYYGKYPRQQWTSLTPSIVSQGYYTQQDGYPSNLEFRFQLADALQCNYYKGGPFTVSRTTNRWKQRKSERDQAFAQMGKARPLWGNYYRGYIPNQADIDAYINYYKNIYNILPDDEALTVTENNGIVSISNPNGGQVYYTINGEDPRNLDGTINTNAILYTGSFPAFAGNIYSVVARSFNISKSNTFEKWSPACPCEPFTISMPYPTGALVINEIHYNPNDYIYFNASTNEMDTVDGTNFEFIEIKNISLQALSLTNLKLTNGIDLIIKDDLVIAPGGFVVFAEDSLWFHTKYGFAADDVYSGKLSNGGEKINLKTPEAVVLDYVEYDDDLPWDPIPDDGEYSLALMDAHQDNALPANWSTQNVFTTPRAENTNASCPSNKVLGNLTLSGNQTHRSILLTSTNGTLNNGADIKLQSENRVRLETGFKVKQGAKLKVRIEECN